MERKNERCVYSGTRLRVYERDQDLFDGSTKVFERAERMSPAYILPVQDGKVLMAYQKQPHKPDRYRGHIGGLIEWGEDPLEGAKRELLEETGCEASSFEEYRRWSSKGAIRLDKYVYIAKGLTKVAEQNLDAGGEIIELKRVSIEEYLDMLIHRKCGGAGWREEIMLKMIDGGIEDFTQLLRSTCY